MTSLFQDHEEVPAALCPEFEALNLPGHYTVCNNGMRLFRIPEILELVLSYLPIRDLLLAQRVNHRFQQTIGGSDKLQRLLFLQAAPFDPSRPVKPILNPLLQSKPPIPPSFLVIHGQGNRCLIALEYTTVHCVTDPISKRIEVEGDGTVCPGWICCLKIRTLCSPLWEPAEPFEEIKCYSTGSWRRMYASQSPYAVWWEARDSTLHNSGAVAKAARMGELWSEYVYSDDLPRTVDYFARRLRRLKDTDRDQDATGLWKVGVQ